MGGSVGRFNLGFKRSDVVFVLAVGTMERLYTLRINLWSSEFKTNLGHKHFAVTLHANAAPNVFNRRFEKWLCSPL